MILWLKIIELILKVSENDFKFFGKLKGSYNMTFFGFTQNLFYLVS